MDTEKRSSGHYFNAVVIWIILTLFVVYSFSLSTATGVFLPSVRESLGLSDIIATYVLQAFVIAYALMQLPAGYLIDNLRARWVVSIGVCFLAIGALLQSMSSTIGLFVAANFIQGIGGAFSFIAAGALIGQWFPFKQFPIWFGLTQAVSCILTGVIHSIFTDLIEVHSWNAIYRVLAFIGFALAALCFVFVRNPKTYTPVKQSFLKPLAAVLKNRQIWLFSAIGLTSFGVMLAYANVWLIEVQKYHAVSMLNSVRVSAYLFAGIGIGTPFLGWLSNVVKTRKGVLHTSLCIGTIFMLAALYLPHFATPTLVIANTVSFGIGFFLSGSMLIYTCAGEIVSGSLRGMAIGLINMFVFVGSTLISSLPYMMVTSEVYYTKLWVIPVLLIMSIALVYFVKETYDSNKEQSVTA